jgi:XTP/dITP diphosphohydrolase
MPPSASADRLWVLASNNAGKLAEFQALLSDSSLELRGQSDFQVTAAEETGMTFVENALLKARHAAAVTGLPAIADDSGLCVDALAGAPGLHSARFAGVGATDAQNVTKLLQALAQVPETQRSAHFYCVIVALRSALDPAPLIAIGRWDGSISHAEKGQNGFGYDPVFWVSGANRTAAELAPDEKNRLSHRGKALRSFRAQWQFTLDKT